jgi:hypothetical protein
MRFIRSERTGTVEAPLQETDNIQHDSRIPFSGPGSQNFNPDSSAISNQPLRKIIPIGDTMRGDSSWTRAGEMLTRNSTSLAVCIVSFSPPGVRLPI